MKFITIDYTEQIATKIMARQHKTVVDGIEVILPKQGYNLTYTQRLRDAEKKAKEINQLILN